VSISYDVIRRAFVDHGRSELTRVTLHLRGGWKAVRALCSPLRWGAWVRRRRSAALSAGWTSVRRAVGVDITAAISNLRRRGPVSKPLLVLNVFLIGVSAGLLVAVSRALVASDRLPPIPPPRPMEVAQSPPNGRGARGRVSAGYDVIAARNLFHPSRSEPTRSGGVAQDAPPSAKPLLYGVVLSDDPGLGLAYLQDPATKRIAGYRIGDDLAGGRVELIERDRVLIRRADELVEVFLNRSNTRPPDSVPASDEAARTAVPTRRIPKD
jgi:Type II secretion system protein C